MDSETLPLAGVRVLDLSRVLAGPWCGQVLANLGASVIKVEHPRHGDDTRDWGLATPAGTTTYFDAVNRNKRSIGLDLAREDGAALARDLARQSDVIIQNFKHGGAERLGLGRDRLAAENGRLIYCSIIGYPGDGPEAERPGYDLVLQGETGLMAMNGSPEQPPLKFGVAAVDLFTGQFAAQAVLAALYERERTGRGKSIELSLLASGTAITSYVGLAALQLGHDPARVGNEHPSIVPYGVYEASDGPFVVTVGNNAQFRRFCAVVGEEGLLDDPRFATNLARAKNRAAIEPIILAALKRCTRADLLRALAAAGIPCGEVSGLHAALTSPRAGAAALVAEPAHPDGATTRVLAPAYVLDGARPPVTRPPPRLGADTDAILAELGVSEARIAALRADGIVG